MNTLIDRPGDLNLDERRFGAPRYKRCRKLEVLRRAKRLHLPNVVASAVLERAFGRGRKPMDTMSRRAMLTNVLPGAVIAIAGVGTLGWAVAPEVADAMPLAMTKGH